MNAFYHNRRLVQCGKLVALSLGLASLPLSEPARALSGLNGAVREQLRLGEGD